MIRSCAGRPIRPSGALECRYENSCRGNNLIVLVESPTWTERLVHVYPTLGRAPEALHRQVALQGIFVHKQAGDILFEPGDFSTGFPFVLAGVARVVKVGTAAPDTLLYQVPAGEYCLLSASGLLAHWHFGARVVAESETQAVVIPGALFRDLVAQCPEFAHSVHLGIAMRVECVMDLVEQATYFRLDRRLATLVLAYGSPLRKSHQELADELGVSRENVSRTLSEFRSRGWVRLGRRLVETLDAAALRACVDRE